MNGTDINQIKKLITEVFDENIFAPIGVSNRHIHLTREACDALFGKGYELTKKADVKQTGQYAANERLNVITDGGRIDNIRILGPIRNYNQVEVSYADARSLRINPPLRDSGVHENSPGITLEGPEGTYTINEGVIIAARHIHVPKDLAEKFDIKDGQKCQVEVSGDRGLIFNNVLLRVGENYVLEMHVDIEEANAAGLKNNDYVRVIL